MADTLRLGTRSSRLALAQTGLVEAALGRLAPETRIEVVEISTRGDESSAPLATIGGTGVFTARIRTALLDGECDIAVHSAKDLPAAPHPQLACFYYGIRTDTSDVLVSTDHVLFADLPAGARIGSCSPRRVAQLKAMRPDLEYLDIRGNIDTRLRKLDSGEYNAIVLASAALTRLGMANRITESLPLIPAAGQGTLAIECRRDDESNCELLQRLCPKPAPAAAERRVLELLDAGCTTPIGVYARGTTDLYRMTAGCWSADGSLGFETHLASANLTFDELAPQIAAEIRRAGGANLRPDSLELLGAHLLLPRPAQSLAAGLRSMGASITCAPVTEAVTQREALKQCCQELPYEGNVWLFTSARAVQLLSPCLDKLPRDTPVGAVAGATAASLAAAGRPADFVADTPNARSLGEAAKIKYPNHRFVWPTSELAPESLQAELPAAKRYNIYTMQPAPTWNARVYDLLKQQRFDAIVLTAGSTAKEIARRIPGSLWRENRFLTLGETTAVTARELGLPILGVAEEPTAAGIAQAYQKALVSERYD